MHYISLHFLCLILYTYYCLSHPVGVGPNQLKKLDPWCTRLGKLRDRCGKPRGKPVRINSTSNLELGTRSLQECILHVKVLSCLFFCRLYKTLSHHEFEVQHCSSQHQLVSSSVQLEVLHPALMALPSKNEVHSTVFFSVCVCGMGGLLLERHCLQDFHHFPIMFNHVPIIFDSSHPFFAY